MAVAVGVGVGPPGGGAGSRRGAGTSSDVPAATGIAALVAGADVVAPTARTSQATVFPTSLASSRKSRAS